MIGTVHLGGWRRALGRLATGGGLILLLGQASALAAQTPSFPRIRWDGDLRPGYHGQMRTEPEGQTTELHELRTRARLGIGLALSEAVELRARVAGRYSTEQTGMRFYVRDHVPATDGLLLGEATLDELHLRLGLGERVELRVGRMQTAFELAGVPRKSLDRNDSPNTDITWTDGLHLTARLGEGVRQHLILQRNSTRGPTNCERPPLNFSDPASRVTVFASLQANPSTGPIMQRELDVTVIPAATPVGSEGEARSAYVAVVARGALRAPVTVAGGKLVLAAEAGYAPTTPPREILRTGGPGEGAGDGRAGQVSVNLQDMRRDHSLGVVHGITGDGWLVSPDIRPNNREWEIRYYWRYSSWGRLDVRLRTREEIRARMGAAGPRRDADLYLRTTIRF